MEESSWKILPDKIFREVDQLDRVFVHVPDLARLGESLHIDEDHPLSLDVPSASAQIKTWLGLEKAAPGMAFVEPSASAAEALNGLSKSDLAVEVENLTYIYPGTSAPAISNMDFSIPKGQFVGMIGQNGGGKTTIMKCLVGLLKPTQSEIFLIKTNHCSKRRRNALIGL